jgi:hypothetical protein
MNKLISEQSLYLCYEESALISAEIHRILYYRKKDQKLSI